MKIREPPVEREKSPSQDEPSFIKVRKDIRRRTYEFALQAIALGRCLPEANDAKVLSRQLLRSGTSIGANVERSSVSV
ncbi:MAG: four helix bundle protein [Ignavibacteria bacterium]|nr:four helix bundle protein [Ignavibacteria bacterium]